MRKLMSSIYQWILKILGIKKGEEDVPQGLQVFNATGELVLDITDDTAKYLGSYETGWNSGAGSGSFVDSRLSGHQTWYAIQWGRRDVVISISGDTVSWVFDGGAQELGVGFAYGIL